MIDTQQGPLVNPPSTALHTHQSIIRPLAPPNNPLRQPKRTQQRRRIHDGPIRKVPHLVVIHDVPVERPRHVLGRQLHKRACPQPGPLEHAVHPRQVHDSRRRTKHVVRKGRPPVRRGHRRQRSDLDPRRLRRRFRNHVARVEAAHAVRDDVDRARVLRGNVVG